MTQYLQAISKITLLLLMGLLIVGFITLMKGWFFFNTETINIYLKITSLLSNTEVYMLYCVILHVLAELQRTNTLYFLKNIMQPLISIHLNTT